MGKTTKKKKIILSFHNTPVTQIVSVYAPADTLSESWCCQVNLSSLISPSATQEEKKYISGFGSSYNNNRSKRI